MKVSAAGRALIEQREGRRLSAYRDSKGVLTIGVGHTGRMSAPKVPVGMTITEAECDAMLATDLAPVEACINRAVTVPLGQNEFDALASLGFNIGVGGLTKSTVVKRLNLGDIAGAAEAILLWDHPAVLEGRREAERKQFLEPDPANDTGVSRSQTVARARATTLTAKAAATKASVPRTAGGGVIVAAAGTAATVATAAAHHGPLAILFGSLIGIGAAIDGTVAWSRSRTVNTLTLNAAKQAVAAKTPTVPTPAKA